MRISQGGAGGDGGNGIIDSQVPDLGTNGKIGDPGTDGGDNLSEVGGGGNGGKAGEGKGGGIYVADGLLIVQIAPSPTTGPSVAMVVKVARRAKPIPRSEDSLGAPMPILGGGFGGHGGNDRRGRKSRTRRQWRRRSRWRRRW